MASDADVTDADEHEVTAKLLVCVVTDSHWLL